MARRTLRINFKFLGDYDLLGAAHSADPKDSPFPIRKDVFMMAATWGFLKNQYEDLPSGKGATHDLFKEEQFTETDKAAITAMYISHNNMHIEKALSDESGKYDQAERWAEAGLKWLKIHILHDTDQANIYSLADWVTGEEFA